MSQFLLASVKRPLLTFGWGSRPTSLSEPLFSASIFELNAQMQPKAGTAVRTLLVKPDRYIHNPASVFLPEYLTQQILAFSLKYLKNKFKIWPIF